MHEKKRKSIHMRLFEKFKAIDLAFPFLLFVHGITTCKIIQQILIRKL